MSHQVNGWQCAPRTDVILESGDNHNVPAQEHLVVYALEPGCRITGFEPPMLVEDMHSMMSWVMTVSNGALDDIVFTNDEGSTADWRTMMLPGFTSYTIAVGQTATFAYSMTEPKGWYPIVAGVMS